MSEDRFNALLLLYVHSDIKLDYKKIIDMYAMRYPRRMVLKNPLTEQWLMKKVWLHSKGLWSFWNFSNSVGFLQMWKAVGTKLTMYVFM